MNLTEQRDEINNALGIDTEAEWALMMEDIEIDNDDHSEISFDNSDIALVESGNTVTGGVIA